MDVEPEPTLQQKLAALTQYLDEVPIQLFKDKSEVLTPAQLQEEETNFVAMVGVLMPHQQQLIREISPALYCITPEEILENWESLTTKQRIRLFEEIGLDWRAMVIRNLSLISYRSTVFTTLARAEQMAEHGNTLEAASASIPEEFKSANPIHELGKICLASAALLCATAHIQGMQTHLKYLIELGALQPGTVSGLDKLQDLYGRSVWEQSQVLPRIKSNGRLHLDRYKFLAQRLHQLIIIRNKLVHLQDPIVVVDGNKPVTVIGDMADPNQEITYGFRVEDDLVHMEVSEAITADPWTGVSYKKIADYLAAVRAYYKEVIDPNALDMVAGELLISSAGTTPAALTQPPPPPPI